MNLNPFKRASSASPDRSTADLAWMDQWVPEVLSDTGHFVKLRTPDEAATMWVSQMPMFCEKLWAKGFRFIAGTEAVIVCEKIDQ
jgi:hypothetical protein